MDCTSFRDEMLDVLYGESDPATVRRVEEHHAECPGCREEMESFRRVRRNFTAWKIPESLHVGRHFARPLWGYRLAAAAAVILAVGGALGLSGAEFRYERGPVAVRIGRSPAAEVERLLAEQEARHGEQIRSLQASLGGRPAAHDDEAVLQRVAQMIQESESRQAKTMNASLSQLTDWVEHRRRYDLAGIRASLEYLNGESGRHMARTTRMMGQVLQASDKR